MGNIEVLQKLDLSPSEAKAYLAVLSAGEARVSEIGKLIGVTRMAGYTAAEELIKKGLLSYTSKEGKKKVLAEDPGRLEIILHEKKQKLHDEENALQRLMPELATLYATVDIKPNVKIFSGLEGLKTLGEDMLKTLKNGETYTGYGSIREEFSEMRDYFDFFVPRRVKRQIKFRGIVPIEPSEGDGIEDRQKIRELRYISPEEFPFKNEINIYGNKISIFSFKEQIGLLVESKKIADTQRLIFELAWRGASHNAASQKSKVESP